MINGRLIHFLWIRCSAQPSVYLKIVELVFWWMEPVGISFICIFWLGCTEIPVVSVVECANGIEHEHIFVSQIWRMRHSYIQFVCIFLSWVML